MGNSALKIVAASDIKELELMGMNFPVEWVRFSIGKSMSTYLVAQEEGRYSLLIPNWLEDTLRKMAPGPVVCTDIDILFQPALGLEPLSIFRRISRYTNVVVLWPGVYKDGTLSYARPEHKHYHFWKNLDGIEIIGANDALQ